MSDRKCLLTYKLASLTDFDDLYRIKCDKENIAWGGFCKAPERTDFEKWYEAQLSSDKRFIYLVYNNGVACAFFYIEKVSDYVYELSSSGVLKQFTGLGIGTYTVKKRLDIIRSYGGGIASRGLLVTILLHTKDLKNLVLCVPKNMNFVIYRFSGANTNFSNGLRNYK